MFTDNEGGRWKSALPHMARIISLLGPPPQNLLDMTPVTKAFFDKTGKEEPVYRDPRYGKLLQMASSLTANHDR